MPMQFQNILAPLAGIARVAFAYNANGWAGVALIGGGDEPKSSGLSIQAKLDAISFKFIFDIFSIFGRKTREEVSLCKIVAFS